MSEDFCDWSDRKRVEQDRYDYATNSGQYAPKPDTSSYDWSSPSSSSPYAPTGGGYSGGGYSGGYSGSYGPIGPTFLSVVPFIPALPVLYPLPFALAFAGSGIGYGILETQLVVYSAAGRDTLAVAAFLIAAVLFVTLTRLDTRLAASRLWRAPRHVLRLALVMAIAHVAAVSVLAAPGQPVEDAILNTAMLRNTTYLGALAVAPVLAHILLTRPALRDWWHTRLEKAWLKRTA